MFRLHFLCVCYLFLFLLIFIREIVKDLENIKGDMANNYMTIPVKYGEVMAKKIITTLSLLSIVPVYFLVNIYEVGYMDIYFYMSMILLIVFLLKLWKSNQKSDYLLLHNLLKFIIVSGVFSIVLINPMVLVHGRSYLKI